MQVKDHFLCFIRVPAISIGLSKYLLQLKNGATRMRVQMKYNAYSTSCETFSYGEVEDYTVTIVGGTNTISEINNSISDYTSESI